MLSDEEKEAIDELWHFDCAYNREIKIVLNLIDKQSKEIEELNKSDTSKEQSSMNYYNLYKELEDKIKAKIEEIKKSKENIYFEEHLGSILQSLLEKED